MIDLIFWLSIDYFRSSVQLSKVASWQAPQTAISKRSILKGHPESNQSFRLAIEIGGILVDINQRAYFFILEDRHGLSDQRFFYSQFVAQLFYPLCISYLLKYFVMFVQRVPYFIDRLRFIIDQLSVSSESFRLKKEMDLTSRIQKIFAQSMLAFSCFAIKDGGALRSRMKVLDKPIYFLNSLLTILWSNEVLDDRIAILIKATHDFFQGFDLHSFLSYQIKIELTLRRIDDIFYYHTTAQIIYSFKDHMFILFLYCSGKSMKFLRFMYIFGCSVERLASCKCQVQAYLDRFDVLGQLLWTKVPVNITKLPASISRGTKSSSLNYIVFKVMYLWRPSSSISHL